MSKSVLVIDTPESCSECILREMSHCMVTQEMLGGTHRCPLSPLPPRKVLPSYVQRGDTKSMTHLIEDIIGAGYNKCLDDLQKGVANEG